MEHEVNQEKRTKFMEFAGKRVNNVLHDIQILEPMARSNAYDFTKQDVEQMFSAMQETLNEAKEEFNKKFEEKSRATKKVFTFGTSVNTEAIESTQSDSPQSDSPQIVETIEEAKTIGNIEDESSYVGESLS